MKKNWVLVLPAALTALLLWAIYPPMGEVCAMAFALVPLMTVSRMCAPKRAACAWGLGGFLFWFATLSWMLAVTKNEGPLPLVILGWVGLSLLCSAYFAAFGYLSSLAWQRHGKLAIVFEPVLWAGLEWGRSWLFTGFAWNFLGTAAGQIPNLASPAKIGGVYLVSALVVLLNGVFTTLVCRMLSQMRPDVDEIRFGRWDAGFGSRWVRMLETAGPLGAILACFALGNLSQNSSGTVPIRVALVQRNAPCIFSRRDKSLDPYDVYDKLLDTAAAVKPDLIVWPESAMSEFGNLDSSNARHAALFFARKTGGASVLSGGDWHYMVGNERRTWNAAALYTPTATGVELQVYGKQHLVPFGEYIPFDKQITILQGLSPVGVSLWPGKAEVFDLKLVNGCEKARRSIKIAPIICFEDTDPVLVRRAAKMGAQAVVLITNDSWFADSHETVQHAWQAVLRAVECDLPVIRVGNSGVTGVISGRGRARWLENGRGQSLTDSQGTMIEQVNVPAEPMLTPYSKFGDSPLAIIFVAVLAILTRKRGFVQSFEQSAQK